MTEPIPNLGESDVTVTVDELVQQADRLGLTWILRPATVIGDNTVVYDGEDTVEQPVTSLIGLLKSDTRVMVMFVPPSGNYIIGVLGDSFTLGGTITVMPEEDAGSIAIQFNHGYSIYVDNTGAGADDSRLWIDTPDGGQVVIGPRAGASWLTDFRVRTDATVALAANMHIDSSTGRIRRATSSARFKTNIIDAEIDLDRVRRLRPVSFHDKGEFAEHGDRAPRHIGFIAEEVDALGLSEFVDYNDEGEPDSVQYDRMVPALLMMINDLTDRVTQLESRNV